MIALSSDYLLFELSNGESVPLSASMISVEMLGPKSAGMDLELVQQAAKAVFHYFKHELGRKAMTIAEFATALEKVLRGLSPGQGPEKPARPAQKMLESDLGLLATQSGASGELLFFPLLRDELRRQVGQGPCVLNFRGLRGCVKQLTGARRWSLRCSSLADQVVAYMRECLASQKGQDGLTLLVR